MYICYVSDSIMKRRIFLKRTGLGLASLSSLDVVFASSMPKDYIPLTGPQDPFKELNKHKQMVVLNDRPLNIEAQAHLLNDDVTPAEKMFVRNNGITPENIDPNDWKLVIDGESCIKSRSFTLEELKTTFNSYTYQLVLGCGGNGRSEFNPPTKGNQWTIGAISCPRWTGVRLRDVLESVGMKEDAVYLAYHSRDEHLSGDSKKDAISRGIPISKALMDETLLAYHMNNEDLPLIHGQPLRLVVGGWPASASGKWLERLSIRNIVHDGAKMGGQSYRVPCETVAPGTVVADEDMCIIESMPVKSLITYPRSGAILKKQMKLEIKGHAWAGELEVSAVYYSIDFGARWHVCQLSAPVNRLAWQHFKAEVQFPKKGYYEVWVRARDQNGMDQPMILPGWNPKGYLNNACHRIAVNVV